MSTAKACLRASLATAVLSGVLTTAPALADGPHIAFHGTEGAYTITLFSAPDPLTAGPAELTLLVQRSDDGALVPAARAAGQLSLPSKPPIAFALSAGAAVAGQLPTATVLLPQAGRYAFALSVSAPGAAPAAFHGSLPVAENNGRRNTVLWAVFLPVVLLALFLANQAGKTRLRSARDRGLPD